MVRMLLAVAGALASAAAASADVLFLTDGRLVEGPKMEKLDDKVVLHYQNGDVDVPLALVKQVIIDADLDALPKTERRLLEKQLSQKRAEIEDAKAHSEWANRYREETKNFQWEYTIPKHVAEGFQKRFESYYEIFSKEWKVRRDTKKPKMAVNLYREWSEFRRTAGAGGGTLAYFMFVGDQYDLNACFDRTDPVQTEMVFYHELSHYMQKLIDEEFRMPHWPGEGLAEYYGGALWDEEKQELEVGLVQPGRLNQIKQDILGGDYDTIRNIVTAERDFRAYSWGWALCHFFMSRPQYKAGFKDFVLGLARDKSVKRERGAWNLKYVSGQESLRFLMKCLGLKDEAALDRLQKEFYDYVEKELDFEGPGGVEKAAMAAMRTNMPKKAKRLFQQADAEGDLSAVGLYNFARLTRREDRKQAQALLRRALELDPLSANFWFELGQMTDVDDEKEAERLKALARELDPDVDAWVIDLDFETEVEED